MAEICGTNLRTIKSSVNRVHTYLAALLELESEDDFGLARLVRATLFVHASV